VYAWAVRADEREMTQDDAPLEGQELGRYRVLELLGRGGMGVVYLAEDTGLRRPVALKVLPSRLVGAADRRARLVREARSSAAAQHANIAAVYEVGEDRGRVFIAMEYVAGATLRALIADHPAGMAVADVLRIGRGIARGLGRAHEVGVVHRDLKPDNVMIGSEGDVKILDFGIAKFDDPPTARPLDTATPFVTEDGRVLGTPGYMAPEQAKGQTVDPRADIFALGVILYQMITGRMPFAGENAVELIIAVDRDEPPPPSSHTPTVPSGLERVIERCLHKDPAARYAHGRAVAEALEELSDGKRLGQAAAGRRWLGALRRAWPAAALVVALGAMGLARLLGVARAPASNPTAEAADASTTPAAVPTPIHMLPDASGCTEIAATQYHAGLRSLRSANWEDAHVHFTRAVADDGNCAPALLRLTMTARYFDPPERVREIYRRAVELRDDLGPRDRLLLDAFEPKLRREPPDHDAYHARLRAASEQFPLDAELVGLAAFSARDNEEMRGLALRAVELDPGYADAWQTVATTELHAENLEAVQHAVDACLEASPNAVDCLNFSALIHKRTGRCREMARDTERWIARTPNDPRAFELHGWALAASGAPEDTVLEVVRQATAKWPAAERPWRGADERARVAVLRGAFDEAQALFEEMARSAELQAHLGTQVRSAAGRMEILVETGREREAADVAAAFESRKRAWAGGLGVELDRSYEWYELALQAHLHRMGAIDDAGWLDAMTQWRDRSRVANTMTEHDLWAGSDALGAHTADDARAAVARMPAKLLGTAAAAWGDWTYPYTGRVLFLAGEPERAVPWLRAGAAACIALSHPFLHVRAQLWLGLALEAIEDREGACAAYRNVLDRWGRAVPPSVTAREAGRRRRALACK
jgi:eukaryotic-like serine/threonine-protein kinase